MKNLEWYFDFISPFSYLAMEQSHRLLQNADVSFKPVLFAGLLNHWHHKGPAELPPKRRYTMRYVQWLAHKHEIPLTMPPAHPFNPLNALRLSIVLHNDPDAIRAIFRFIWRDGRRPDDPQSWHELIEQLDVLDAEKRIAANDVKQELRANGRRALDLGVFGVPSLVVDGELFWGFDALDFVIDYLRNPAIFDSDEMRRITELPVGVERRKD